MIAAGINEGSYTVESKYLFCVVLVCFKQGKYQESGLIWRAVEKFNCQITWKVEHGMSDPKSYSTQLFLEKTIFKGTTHQTP